MLLLLLASTTAEMRPDEAASQKMMMMMWSADVPLLRLLWLFLALILVGLALNLVVVRRLLRLFRRDPDQLLNGAGIYLLAMAAADFCALLTLLLHLVLDLVAPLRQQHGALEQIGCKVLVFAAHVAATQSMWCWLAMSALRCWAACRPLRYSTVWRSPCSTLLSLGIGAVLLQLFTLFTFDSFSSESSELCSAARTTGWRVWTAFDTALSFLLPAAIIIAMDVLVCRAVPHHSSTRSNTSPSSVMMIRCYGRVETKQLHCLLPTSELELDKYQRRTKSTRRFMLVSLVALALAAPDQMFRVARLVSSSLDASLSRAAMEEEGYFPLPTLYLGARLLILIKLSFNAFYFTSFVYDRNLMSKTTSSRQLSISARRLEGPSLVPRTRAYTIAAGRGGVRTPSPIPTFATAAVDGRQMTRTLTRQSSCCNLSTPGLSSPPRSPPVVVLVVEDEERQEDGGGRRGNSCRRLASSNDDDRLTSSRERAWRQ